MKDLVMRFEQKDVRIFDNKGNPFFSVSDICRILEISNVTNAMKSIDNKDDIHTIKVIDSIGRKQNIYIVNEAGLYDLIFKSRKKEAKLFKRWVFEQVLPSIRKTGSYSIAPNLKQKSIDTRKMLTDEWHNNGVNKGWEYGKLTLAEYRLLKFKESKRKKDLDEGELKALMALEAMEMLNLHYNPVKGRLECEASLGITASKVLETKGMKELS